MSDEFYYIIRNAIDNVFDKHDVRKHKKGRGLSKSYAAGKLSDNQYKEYKKLIENKKMTPKEAVEIVENHE